MRGFGCSFLWHNGFRGSWWRRLPRGEITHEILTDFASINPPSNCIAYGRVTGTYDVARTGVPWLYVLPLNSTFDSSIINLDSALLLLVVYSCLKESTFPIGRLRFSLSLSRGVENAPLISIIPVRVARGIYVSKIDLSTDYQRVSITWIISRIIGG